MEDIPFIVKESSEDKSALLEAHAEDLRQFLIQHSRMLQRSEHPVTLKDFSHVMLSLWEEAPSAYPPRPYIAMNEWIPIQQLLDCKYELKNIAADHIYQGGNLIFQLRKS